MSGKTNENNFIGILILIFFMIGVPSFLIKEVTKGESEPAAVSKVVPAKANQKNSFAESQTDGETFAFTAPVVDEAKVFSESARGKLNEFLVNLNDTKGIQIGVLIVNDMGGESIESFSLRHAEKWALGQKGIDNGALLVVAMKEHGVHIETGYGTEGVLTDAKCARILRNVLVPAFKSGNYEEGITKAVEYMAAIISEDESMVTSAGVKSEKNESKGSVPVPVLIFVIIWVLMLFSAMTSSIWRRRRGIFFVPFIGVFGNDHWGGSGFGGGFSGGSGFSGGGFSGGGGSFGGGGASSSW